jgi:winged helix DNA-binding protein
MLVDGRAAGVWSHELRHGQVRVQVEPFEELCGKTRTAVQDGVERLAAFLGGSPELSNARLSEARLSERAPARDS